MHVLVLAPSPHHTVGVDLASGAFVRMDHPAPAGIALQTAPRWFDVAVGRVGERDSRDGLVSHRESVTLDRPLNKVGRMSERKADRFLRALHHIPGSSILGSEGPALPMWAIGTTPGVAIVRPEGRLFLDVNESGVWAIFGWKRHTHRVRIEDRRVLARLDWFPSNPVLADNLGPTLGFVPKRLLVCYGEPVNGYCYKTAVSLLH